MNEVFGFVVEPHRNGYYLVSPATKGGEDITCHDCSGFLGSWKMKPDGVFFESVDESVFCNEAMSTASAYANKKNGVK